jgi:hypothetical protein
MGLEGLTARSRKAVRRARQLPLKITNEFFSINRKHPSYGAPTSERHYVKGLAMGRPVSPSEPSMPPSDRNGLVNQNALDDTRPEGTALTIPTGPHDRGCAD